MRNDHLNEDQVEKAANLVFQIYDKCPSRARPRSRSNEIPEWTNLAAVILVDRKPTIICAAVATGVKVMPNDKIKNCGGKILHDCHAETLALRGFNRYLLNESKRLEDDNVYVSTSVERHNGVGEPKYRIRSTLQLYLLVTEIPCGDASMENLGAGKLPNWEFDYKIMGQKMLKGRAYYSELGMIRTKPGRSDSPESLSKSCTDKLLMKQYTSVLLSPTSYVFSPKGAYLRAILVPRSKIIDSAFNRAFRIEERIKGIAKTQYDFDWIGYNTTFKDSKENTKAGGRPCSVSMVYIENESEQVEAITRGMRMGWKAGSEGSISKLSRRKMAELAGEISETVRNKLRYSELKDESTAREQIKWKTRSNLGRWIRTGDDDFQLCQN
ncbi:adenosine deaminase/editase [Lipomyces oligophaga]|uniref:adenosine deaminase/editase n=1 Tax=Lipomyces oligophaga TaxID=45792 RepID=UPI0034CEED70